MDQGTIATLIIVGLALASLLRSSPAEGAVDFDPGSDEWLWPVPSYAYISSRFGYRIDPVTGAEGVFHAGLDIAAMEGAPVLATQIGRVTFVGVAGNYGNRVVVDHGGGLVSSYNHLMGFGATVGEEVRRGDLVGWVGTTGKSTGPHLHFEIRVSGTPIDPLEVVSIPT